VGEGVSSAGLSEQIHYSGEESQTKDEYYGGGHQQFQEKQSHREEQSKENDSRSAFDIA
jgi:hypothetical protein